MYTIFHLIFLSCALSASPVFSTYAKKQFVERFHNSLDEQKKRFYSNRKITANVRNYKIETIGPSSFTGQLNDDWTAITIFNSASEYYNIITDSKILKHRIGIGTFITNGLKYHISKENNKYKLSDIHNQNNPLAVIGGCSATRPTSMFNNIYSIDSYMLYIDDPSRIGRSKLEFKSISQSTFQGTDCLAVRTSIQSDKGTSDEVSYFDPANAHAFLGSTAKRPANMGYQLAHTRHDVMEYHTPPGARFPVPKRYTCHVEFPGKPPILHVEIDYVGFEDYVPDPEEFKLEKRYGLTTPAGPQDLHLKGSVGRSVDGRFTYWWAVHLGAGVLLVGVLTWLIYRRKQQRPV